MQPGQRFEPGQTGSSDDQTKPIDASQDQPVSDNVPAGSSVPVEPPTSLPDEPATDQPVAPAAGVPAEAASADNTAADLGTSPASEQSGEAAEDAPQAALDTTSDTPPVTPPASLPAEGDSAPDETTPEPPEPDTTAPSDTPPATDPASSADEPAGETPVDMPTPPPPPPEEPTTGPTPSEQPDTEQDNNPAQFSWRASEYIEHHHSTLWYTGLATTTAVLAVFCVLILKEILSAVIAVLMAVAVLVYARRQPRNLQYRVDAHGIKIDNKYYPYTDFRSFAVVKTKSLTTLELDPTRRFMPRLSMILTPDHADGVIATLGVHLPSEDREPELVDRLAHALKF